jgi:ribosomal protein S12 methylthiotransferase
LSVSSRENTYYLLSLGCAKNTVDSESMAQLLNSGGLRGVDDAQHAEVLIVNTCGFIRAAREESLEALRKLAAHKKRDQLLIAAGCLSQRYGSTLAKEVPGLDGIIGTRRWMDIVDLVQQLRGLRAHKHPEPLYHLPTDAVTVGADERGVRRVSIQGASAYVKIADGCRRPCAFCAIPLIKGTLVSRPVESIVAEARALEAAGVREMVLIAQDTTDYGHDLGLPDGLSLLLDRLTADAPGIPWIRIMYTYPGAVTDRLIETMATRPQIVHYLDMPLQHASRSVLLRMRRPANVEWCYRTIEKMRAAMPDLAIRTTFIVGYPGETDQEFEELLAFVRDMQFDRVGVFTYSFEENTPAAEQPGHLPEDMKQARRDALMALQQSISLARNQALVGQTLHVLTEGQGDGLTVARSARDAPEIDGYVLIDGDVPVGQIVPVWITGALCYDLTATADIDRALPVGAETISTIPLLVAGKST